MTTISVAAGRRIKMLGPGIALLGAVTVLSPYLWHSTWRDTGFSFGYVPFHLWCWLPFVVLAFAAGRLGRVAGGLFAAGLMAGTVATVELTQALDDGSERLGLALPGLLSLAVIGAWGLKAHPRGNGRISRQLVIAVVALLALVIIGGRIGELGEAARAQTFLVIGTSIALEAMPFVLLGAAVSAAIEVFVPSRWFERIARLPLPLQVPAVALSGVAMPVCECGSVPVARRLIMRGVHPAAGIAFMLAAPVINPIVLFSTAVAYSGRGATEMVLGRLGLGLVLAMVAGALIASRGGGAALAAHARKGRGASEHDHSQGRLRGFIDHLMSDLLLMGKYIVLGAAIAAALQTIVPQSVFTGVLTSPFVGALLMITLAFFLSLCSEADAFVAVSFIQFPPGPQLAFLVAGPVFDTKLVLLYGSAFGRAFVVKLALVIVPVVVAGSMLFQAVI
ncbi:permease [Solirubrobacter sp. CPCC 204708]|uniref:Permease n=1 Tax=Solirubrobacter deserti TaxID=2282478 RepID=A0ABT4RD43_9ACTN|nr:permease [Solirubrobacter deserti]MBE2315631.1 permease [Solirubrobacter deserti]MDA0136270.1 permease [Solirubrobacter deserti]